MNTKTFDIPILLIAFNRPETTCHVLEQIRKIKPSKLYIFSDAARAENQEEAELVDLCRHLYSDSQINWLCQIERWYPETNMGKAIGVSSAISWAFETSDRLIILEDDCLPSQSFFKFCKVMLEKYELNDQIMHISGTRWTTDHKLVQRDHFFSRIGDTWGWATWKRAWNKYDFWMEHFPEMKHQKQIEKLFGDAEVAEYWHKKLDSAYQEQKKADWSQQWQYTLFQHKGLSAVPSVNLISNIGIRKDDPLPAKDSYPFHEAKVWIDLKSDSNFAVDNSYEKHHLKRISVKKPPVRIRILKSFRSLFRGSAQ